MISKARRGEFRGTVARASGAATSRNPEAPPPFFPKLSQNWPPSSVSQHLRNEKRQPTARYLSLVPKSRPYSGLVSGSVSGPFASIFDEWSARRRQGWVRTERAPQIKLGVLSFFGAAVCVPLYAAGRESTDCSFFELCVNHISASNSARTSSQKLSPSRDQSTRCALQGDMEKQRRKLANRAPACNFGTGFWPRCEYAPN